MIGERIGNFSVTTKVGEGGMGEVFLGIHDAIGTKVAIKMLLPHISANKDHVQRFFNEAIAAGKIQHAGIGKIFDVGFTAAGRAYLVMEFLDGETLSSRIRRLGRLPIEQVRDIARQISSVLEAVHKAGITHRDLKPDNIFLVGDTEQDSGERVKILDFGIAKLSAAGGLTSTGAGTMGTPAYMAPEQWRSSKNVDWRADAYSLGCVVFEMASGHPPFTFETIGEACGKHLTEEPQRLATLGPVPPEIDALVASLLAKQPEQRPASLREIAKTFGGAGASSSMPMAVTTPLHPPVARTEPVITKQLTTLGGAATGVEADAPKQRTRGVLIALAGAGLVAAVVIVVAVTRSSSTGEHTVTATPDAATPDVAITATPILEPDAAVRSEPIARIDPLADAGVTTAPLRKSAEPPTRRPADRPTAPPPTPPPSPALSEITKDMVTNKFMIARRLYTTYKNQNGNRLDGDYNDLIVFLQFDKPPADKLKRVEAFIAKIRSDDAGPPADAKPSKSTTLSNADFRAGMVKIESAVLGCYGGTNGSVNVRVVIAPSGQVTKTSVTGAFAGTPEGACVEAAVGRAVFPAWEGPPQSFSYAYLFDE